MPAPLITMIENFSWHFSTNIFEDLFAEILPQHSSVNIDASCRTNSEGNLKQDSGHDNTSAPDISINDSNSDEHQEETSSRVSNSSSTELSICGKPKSLEDKEMDNFLKPGKKLQHESHTESSPKENTYMSNNGVSAKAHIKSNISPEQEKEQGLIQEISISINQNQATEISANNSPKMFAKNHVSKNLIQESSGKGDIILFSASKSKVLLNLTSLYKKACDAERQAIKVNQDEITCWYYYIIEFDNQVKNLMKSDHIGEKKAKGQIYDFIIAQLNTKRKTLQKQTQKARKVYNLFEKIGIDKIQHIKTFSADAISRFTNLQIQTVIDHFAKMPDIEFTDDQDNSSDDLPEAEVSISIDQDSELPEAEVNASELMCDYMAGNRRARRSRTDAQYFDEFRTHFWKRPEDEFDRIRIINTTNRRRNTDVGNITPAPSIEEVEHELSMGSSVRRINRSSSITTISDAEQNNGVHLPLAETSSLQPPPPYEATDEAQNNSSEMNQSHVVSNREVAVSGNIPLSQNNSDVSMYDVGDSQTFSNMESI
ncbi:6947_t:CDS:2 [Acaulospora morrowiae]|uniref:6947_t:CDS:1 n=1 Tax=Acaulospora morrowiae TaxID=94023 RepID=A0A9N8VFW8_9GLOM|nr:6947_t:CDS:2 [Acaulospora morrowiae]